MRPPKARQSALRTPLNRILGAEANVRILRVAVMEPEPVTRSELARRAGLEAKGAHLAANRLLVEGVLKRVGAGSLQQVALEQGHPLANAIQGLFRAENERVDGIINGLRAVAKELYDDLDSAWIQGPFATREDAPGDPLTIGVLAKTSATPRFTKTLRQAVRKIEESNDVTIELKTYTRPDLATLRPSDAKVLSEVVTIFGPPPIVFTDSGQDMRAKRNMITHSDREFQQQILAKEIVSRLTRDPAVRRRALEYLTRRLKIASPQERQELEEWQAILESTSTARLERFLLDPGERATRLRQTLPFMEVLSQHDREELLRSMKRSMKPYDTI